MLVVVGYEHIHFQGSHDGTLASLRRYGESQLIRALSSGNSSGGGTSSSSSSSSSSGGGGENAGRRLHDQLWGGQEEENNRALERIKKKRAIMIRESWFKQSLSTRLSLTSSVVESVLENVTTYTSPSTARNDCLWYSREILLRDQHHLRPFLYELVDDMACRLDEDWYEYVNIVIFLLLLFTTLVLSSSGGHTDFH